VRQWWGWIFLIPLLLMATLCCFTVVMFKGNAAGTWFQHKRFQVYSRVGLENDVDAGMMSSDSLLLQSPPHVFPESQPVCNSPTPNIDEAMMSSDSLSPQSPVQQSPENQLVGNSPTPGPSQSVPVCPVSTRPDLCRSVTVRPSPSRPVLARPGLSWPARSAPVCPGPIQPITPRPTPQASQALPKSSVHPQTCNIVVPMVPWPRAQLRHPSPAPRAQTGVMASPRQLPQQLQQQQRQGGQRQMSSVASQQQLQVQDQKNPPSQQAGFASTSPVNADIASSLSVPVDTPSMVLATSGGPPNVAEVASPVVHPNPPQVLSQITSSVQAVVAETWCHELCQLKHGWPVSKLNAGVCHANAAGENPPSKLWHHGV